MGDVQEMSFQNVVDTILKPEGIKVGGYPDDLFLDLSDEDRERWQCNICFLVSREPQHCDNKHNFCATCVFAWSMTYGANSDKCPVCRVKQQEYLKNNKLEAETMHKWVKCPEIGCALRCTLRDFLKHSHGIKLFGTSTDLSELRRARPAPVNPITSGLIFLPSLSSENRNGLTQGRSLLQDMMLVLHMEMELRRRAIERFHTDADADERRRHFNEVIAIQTQMQEITTFLDLLFRAPPLTRLHSRAQGMNRFPGSISRNDDDASDSDSSDSSESSGVVSRFRLTERNRQTQEATRISGNRNSTGPSANIFSTPHPPTQARSTGGNTVENRNPVLEADYPRVVYGASSSNTTLTTPITTSVPTTTTASQTTTSTANTGPLLARRNASNNTVNSSIAPQRNVITTTVDVEVETVTPIATASRNSEQTNTRTTGAGVLPRPSSTFQSVVEQLPPISRDHSTVEENLNLQNNHDSMIESNTRPDDTMPSNRRPAPPPTQGARLNTTRVRRRTTSNSNSISNANTRNTNTNLTASRLTSRPQANRSTGTRARGRSDPTLPATSGALLRARRRSEIHQQLMDDATANIEGDQD